MTYKKHQRRILGLKCQFTIPSMLCAKLQTISCSIHIFYLILQNEKIISESGWPIRLLCQPNGTSNVLMYMQARPEFFRHIIQQHSVVKASIFIRKTVKILIIIAVVPILFVTGAVLALYSPWMQELSRSKAVEYLNSMPGRTQFMPRQFQAPFSAAGRTRRPLLCCRRRYSRSRLEAACRRKHAAAAAG